MKPPLPYKQGFERLLKACFGTVAPEPEPVRVAPNGTSTVQIAFNKCRHEKLTFMVETTPFALLGWKSDDGSTKGPFIVTVFLATAIEIGENGRFKDMFPAGAEGYFPWVEEKT
jgi:hypothetical protein